MRVATLTAAAIATTAAVLISGCGHPTPPATSGPTTVPPTSTSAMAMPGMTEPMPAENGLSTSQSGYSLQPAVTTIMANTPTTFTFRIVGSDGATVTDFVPVQTKLLHFYLIRADLTGFDHVHPDLAPDGTWTIGLPAMAPGSWRVYTQFSTQRPGNAIVPLVLSVPLNVPGAADIQSLPPSGTTATVDGYTLTMGGQPAAGVEAHLTFTVSRDGRPVTDLEPYLDTYAHVTAFAASDMAFAHLHALNPVVGAHGGPDLTLHAMFPTPGDWRLFIQFQTAATLRTAAVTIQVH